MRTLAQLTVVSLVAACRFGFPNQLDAGGPEADASPDSPPDAPPVFSCTPARFSISGTTKRLTTAATPRGIDVFLVDENGVVRGFSYELAMGKLELRAGTGSVLPVPTAIAPLGAVALDHDSRDDIDVIVAVPYGNPNPTGTALIPFNAQLQRLDVPMMHDGWLAGAGNLAVSEGGTVALLDVSKADGTLETQAVSRSGVGLGASHPIDTRGHSVTRATLLRAESGYMAVWGANADTPIDNDEVDAAIIDDNLDAKPPVTINLDPDFDSFLPSAGYSSVSKKYLFAWVEKHANDVIKLRMRDDRLVDAPGLIDVMQRGTLPVVVAGDTDFLVVWQDAGATGRLGAARVASNGSYILRGVTNTGGPAAAWDVAVRYGQPTLVWVEDSGTGPTLWVDPLCN